MLTGLPRFRWLPAWTSVWEVNVAQEASTPLEILSHLRQDLAKYFDREELRTLCFDLGIEHENLPDAKDSLARELVAHCERHQRTFELTRKCRELRPDVSWPNVPAYLFICYRRDADPDQKLANYLHDFLAAQGHDVFIDTDMRTGTAWLEKIDQKIRSSDFLIVLLSKTSADSEMVKAEVGRAYEYRQLQRRPCILPVRLAYEGLLPYAIAAFLNPIHYVVWQSEADDERVGRDILDAIQGRLPARSPIQPALAVGRMIVSEDGRRIADDDALHPPLPEFDPRFLEELEVPGGAVKLRDRFYVRREADAHFEREVARQGSTTTIRAARQTGKSSLLIRGVQHARERGARVVYLDMARVDQEYLKKPELFLRYLAEFIVRELELDVAQVDKAWSGSLGPQDKLTYLLKNHVLPASDALVVLAMDEVDRLLQTPFHSDFFGMLRSWHNNRAFDDRWTKLNIVMVISTEPHLLITDMQSPFNVGLRLYLEDFTSAQVRDLNQRHGSPVQDKDFSGFMELLSGQPYLTRRALYALVTERWTYSDLLRVATSDQGPFGDHLRHLHWLLRDEPDLREALKQIIRQEHCGDDERFFRLLRAGLVKGSGAVCKCRCDLYRMYFEDKL
jgi:hypothetical protein